MEVIVSHSHVEKQRKLIALYRQQKVNLGMGDLYYFAKYILGYNLVSEEPHRGMSDFIMHPHKRKMDLEPRGSFKSTVITISYSILSILRNPNIRILIDSEDLAVSKKFLSEIKPHFESNNEFRKLFGDLAGRKWTDSEIIVSSRTQNRKEPTIMTGGVETPRVGMHVDLLIQDDLHSQHNTQTPEQVEKVIKHWQLNGSILEPEGEEIIIGTRWLVGDLYDTIMTQERMRRKAGLPPKYLIRKRSAYNKDGTLYFPNRLTHEFLEDQKIIQGSRIFACQYLNDAVDESAVLFKPSWIKWYGRNTPSNLYITAIVDPAISQKDDACNTAFTQVGTDADGFLYVLDAIILKCLPHELIDWILKLQQLWNPKVFGVETVAFQKAIKYWAQERMRNTGQWVNIQELKTDTKVTKDMRIKALIPYVESGTLQFPGSGPQTLSGGLRQLYNEMTTYPMCKTFDGLDSLAYHLQLYTPPAQRRKVVEAPNYSPEQIMKKLRTKYSGPKNVNGVPTIGRRSILDKQSNPTLTRVA